MPSEQTSETVEDETPPQIKHQEDGDKFEDITLPDNANHQALIDVHYKRVIIPFLLVFAGTFGSIFYFGILEINIQRIFATSGSAIVVSFLIFLWLYWSGKNE